MPDQKAGIGETSSRDDCELSFAYSIHQKAKSIRGNKKASSRSGGGFFVLLESDITGAGLVQTAETD